MTDVAIDPKWLANRAVLQAKQASRCLAEAYRHAQAAAAAFDRLAAMSVEPDCEALKARETVKRFIDLVGEFV